VEETMDFLVELVFGEVLPKIFDLSVEDRGDCRFGTSASVASVLSRKVGHVFSFTLPLPVWRYLPKNLMLMASLRIIKWHWARGEKGKVLWETTIDTPCEKCIDLALCVSVLQPQVPIDSLNSQLPPACEIQPADVGVSKGFAMSHIWSQKHV